MSRWLLAPPILAIGLVVGFLLGGVGPRRALSAAEDELAAMREELREVERRGGSGWRAPVPGLDRVLRGRERMDEAPPLTVQPPTPPTERTAEARVVVDDAGPPRPRSRQRWFAEGRQTERSTALSRAATAQNVRRVQSRAALRQQAGLSDEEMAQVDGVLESMNEQLAEFGEELVALAMSDGTPPPASLLGVTHDVSGILYQAQTSLEAIVGPGRAADVDPSALEIWNHVDLRRLDTAGLLGTE